MSKHTPGPWRVLNEFGLFLFVVADKGRENINDNPRICCVNQDDTLDDSSTIGTWRESNNDAKANARLIAAAPDLLAALQEINKRLQDHPAFPRDLSGLEDEDIEEPDGDSAEFKYLSDIAQDAIDKAIGETK
jgi:hypothetical protein